MSTTARSQLVAMTAAGPDAHRALDPDSRWARRTRARDQGVGRAVAAAPAPDQEAIVRRAVLCTAGSSATSSATRRSACRAWRRATR